MKIYYFSEPIRDMGVFSVFGYLSKGARNAGLIVDDAIRGLVRIELNIGKHGVLELIVTQISEFHRKHGSSFSRGVWLQEGGETHLSYEQILELAQSWVSKNPKVGAFDKSCHNFTDSIAEALLTGGNGHLYSGKPGYGLSATKVRKEGFSQAVQDKIKHDKFNTSKRTKSTAVPSPEPSASPVAHAGAGGVAPAVAPVGAGIVPSPAAPAVLPDDSAGVVGARHGGPQRRYHPGLFPGGRPDSGPTGLFPQPRLPSASAGAGGVAPAVAPADAGIVPPPAAPAVLPDDAGVVGARHGGDQRRYHPGLFPGGRPDSGPTGLFPQPRLPSTDARVRVAVGADVVSDAGGRVASGVDTVPSVGGRVPVGSDISSVEAAMPAKLSWQSTADAAKASGRELSGAAQGSFMQSAVGEFAGQITSGTVKRLGFSEDVAVASASVASGVAGVAYQCSQLLEYRPDALLVIGFSQAFGPVVRYGSAACGFNPDATLNLVVLVQSAAQIYASPVVGTAKVVGTLAGNFGGLGVSRMAAQTVFAGVDAAVGYFLRAAPAADPEPGAGGR